MNKILVLSCLFFGSLGVSCSLDAEEVSERCLDCFVLKGILLMPDTHSSHEVTRDENVVGVQALMDVPGGVSRLNKVLGPRYIGKEMRQEDLVELKKQIIFYYRDQGYPFIIVQYPSQNISSGLLQLVVIEGKLGEVHVSGNKWFPDAMIQRYIRQKPGAPIQTGPLLNDLAWVNRNPFRHAELIFMQGEQEGTTDIDIQVKDRFPLRVYVGGDNTGNSSTGNARWFAGFNWGNFCMCDQVLSYQYTTSSDFEQFQSHTINYTALLALRQVLNIYGGYSQVKPDITGFKSTGYAAQGSLRYIFPFGSHLGASLNDFFVGGDLKNTNNNLIFEGSQNLAVIAMPVNVSQLCVGYNFAQTNGNHQWNFKIESFWSPGRWLPNQENSHFSALHPGAVNHYIYAKAAFSERYILPYKFIFFSTVRGQISNENLVPSEQFGLGGYDTVRGYSERLVNYDDAICVNLEFYLPSFKLVPKCDNELSFLGFFDYGTGRNVHASGGQENWQQLIGAGPGLRYKMGNYLSARVDLGWKLHRTQYDSTLNAKFHVGVIGSY